MAADRHGPSAASSWRRHELDPRTVGQGSRQERPLAADPLVRGARHLFGKPPDEKVVHFRRIDPAKVHVAGLLDPDFTAGINDDLRHIVLLEPSAKRTQISVQVNAARVAQWDHVGKGFGFLSPDHGCPIAPTREKSRSRAVKTRIGWPCRTRTVGGIPPLC